MERNGCARYGVGDWAGGPWGASFGDNPRLGVVMFLEIGVVADAVDHGEQAGGGEGG